MPCFTKSSMVCLLACLTISSIVEAYPVTAPEKARPTGLLSPRREVPNSNSGDLIGGLLDTIGLSDLDKLNHWKSDNEDSGSDAQPEVIDDSQSATPTQTENNNANNKEGDVQTSSGNQPARRPFFHSQPSVQPQASPTSSAVSAAKSTPSTKTNKTNQTNQTNQKAAQSPVQNTGSWLLDLMKSIQHTVSVALNSKDEQTLN
ncbi:hypothetical protein BO71DRAFT_412695 [Aspergillus ellipticus CBS 707.79]|uniref:Uncharacterized protein n=1 Tax=Aspergillus ellipticus CBS 707.79 TaxID=1448320 RepID=A0A319EH77_9EURO|nr:hypothetical protein BO71DRAFT_412695 [Aspergillus ellipticus CBS 707.79]